MTKEQLLEKANDLPLAPGVYLMMDASGKVIYVGKAKKLKNRVSQYFQLGTGHNEKTRRMVSQVDHFDTIFVSSEFEALILENSLIKQHQPHYNILLKDDKGYPFVRLSHGPYPRFTLANKTADDGARYFGPFGARGETRAAIDTVCAPSACRPARAGSRAISGRSAPASTITWAAATASAAASRTRRNIKSASSRRARSSRVTIRRSHAS